MQFSKIELKKKMHSYQVEHINILLTIRISNAILEEPVMDVATIAGLFTELAASVNAMAGLVLANATVRRIKSVHFPVRIESSWFRKAAINNYGDFSGGIKIEIIFK